MSVHLLNEMMFKTAFESLRKNTGWGGRSLMLFERLLTVGSLSLNIYPVDNALIPF